MTEVFTTIRTVEVMTEVGEPVPARVPGAFAVDLLEDYGRVAGAFALLAGIKG